MIDPPFGRVVEPAEPGTDVVHDRPPVILPRHVEVAKVRVKACGPNALDDRLAWRIRATGDDHDRARFREHLRRARTNPLPGPADQGDLAGEIAHHTPSTPTTFALLAACRSALSDW